uniref:Uncharacterized protein n=1 Tax=Arundo donax TaxID=35708 RepID=A0A0A8ZZF1_ARUDO
MKESHILRTYDRAKYRRLSK